MPGEGRSWLDRALSRAPHEPTVERADALYGATISAELQGEPQVGMALADERRALIEQLADPLAHCMVAYLDGWAAVIRGDLGHAPTCLEAAIDADRDLALKARALVLLGWTHELSGDSAMALVLDVMALALAESHGESLYRSYALRAIGIVRRLRESERATQALREVLGAKEFHAAREEGHSCAWMRRLLTLSGKSSTRPGAGDKREPNAARAGYFFERCPVTRRCGSSSR
jgi:hypothetical protein